MPSSTSTPVCTPPSGWTRGPPGISTWGAPPAASSRAGTPGAPGPGPTRESRCPPDRPGPTSARSFWPLPGRTPCTRGSGARGSRAAKTREALSCYVNDEDRLYIGSLWVEPRHRRVLYALGVITNQDGAHFAYAAYRSQDGGATWKKLPAGISGITVAPGRFRTLYAFDGEQQHLLRSEDGGTSWTVVNRGPFPPVPALYIGAPLAVDPADPSTLFLATADGLLVSHDGGATFQEIDVPLEASRRSIVALLTDPTQPGRIYAAGYEGGLFVGRFE